MDRGLKICTGGSEQNHPKEKKNKKAEWSSEEALQITKERREAKSKRERERYIQLNADFQRTAWRNKRTFFNEQCIKLEENNQRGKTWNLSRKIGDIKGTFCLKVGTIKRHFQFSSVQSLSCVRLFGTKWITACQASLSITNSRSLLKLMPIESVMPSSHLILCSPLLLLPPIPPSIRVFSNESTLRIRWPKYWSFSFSISPSNEHPVLISFRKD